MNETSFNEANGEPITIAVGGNEISLSAAGVMQHHELSRPYVTYVIGTTSVGKNALIKQFKTSEYRGTYQLNDGSAGGGGGTTTDEESDEGVCVMMDDVESRLQFISLDIELAGVHGLGEIVKVNDAFIVVYSISDKASFHVAEEILLTLRSSAEYKTQACILVGNKSDLVRKRCVSVNEGRALAFKYASKFVETSVAINDKVDDLLAGTLKQIRLREVADREMNFFLGQTEMNKAHSRTFSNVHLTDMVKKSNLIVGDGGRSNSSVPNTFSFKKSTLTKKLFRFNKNSNKTKEAGVSQSRKTAFGDTKSTANTTSNYSFFHKLFDTLFKKKSSQTNLQSVENLFTLPGVYASNNKVAKMKNVEAK